MNRNLLLLSLIIAIIGGCGILYVIGESECLVSWTLGSLLGIYPFLFFHITRNLFYSKSGKINSYLLWSILAVKFIITLSVIIFIGTLGFILQTPFTIGFLVMAPTVLTILLIDNLRNKLTVYGK
jgi:hypothetical protein